jgi:hypothetical protein
VTDETPVITSESEPETPAAENNLVSAEDVESDVEAKTEDAASTPTSSATETKDAPANGKKGFSLGRLFGKKAEPTPEVENPQSLDVIFAEETSEAAIAPETDSPETDTPETEAVDSIETDEAPETAETPEMDSPESEESAEESKEEQ